MRIIYAYELDAADVNTQSGRPVSILAQLERLADVVRVFPLRRQLRYLFIAKYLYYRARGLKYRPDREPVILKTLAEQIERRVAGIEADYLFAPGSHVIAELNLPIPMIFCADATFANVLEFYDSFTHCAPEFIEQGHAMDRKALANCAAAIYPSEWAARSAIEDYGADPSKVHVIPFGANVDPPDEFTVQARIEARTFDHLRLLFIGRDWYRKGGDIALATCEELHRRGVAVRLDLVGLLHVPELLPPYAQSHGRLDKREPDQRRRLEQLFGQAHFLFVPSRAENYGMVFCEAAAYGLPSVATRIGGISSIVREGQSGVTLPAQATPRDYASAFENLLRDPGPYRMMSRASLHAYQTRLNWTAFADGVLAVLQDLPEKHYDRF